VTTFFYFIEENDLTYRCVYLSISVRSHVTHLNGLHVVTFGES